MPRFAAASLLALFWACAGSGITFGVHCSCVTPQGSLRGEQSCLPVKICPSMVSYLKIDHHLLHQKCPAHGRTMSLDHQLVFLLPSAAMIRSCCRSQQSSNPAGAGGAVLERRLMPGTDFIRVCCFSCVLHQCMPAHLSHAQCVSGAA